MTSPTGKPKDSSSNQIQATEMIERLEKGLHALTMQLQQTRRTLWLAIKASGGSITIDETDIPALWKLSLSRAGDHQMTMQAETLDEPSQEVLDHLASMLVGTDQLITDAMKQVDLQDYPVQVILAMISDRVVYHGDRWIDTRLARGLHGQSEPENN